MEGQEAEGIAGWYPQISEWGEINFWEKRVLMKNLRSTWRFEVVNLGCER